MDGFDFLPDATFGRGAATALARPGAERAAPRTSFGRVAPPTDGFGFLDDGWAAFGMASGAMSPLRISARPATGTKSGCGCGGGCGGETNGLGFLDSGSSQVPADVWDNTEAHGKCGCGGQCMPGSGCGCPGCRPAIPFSGWVVGQRLSNSVARVPDDALGGHGPLSQAGEGREGLICGPDVTESLVRGLLDWQSYVDRALATYSSTISDSFIGEPGERMFRGTLWAVIMAMLIREAARRCGAGGPFDLKGGKATKPPCPTLCANSITLCGECLNDDVPGNLAYGFHAEYTIGCTLAKWLSNEGNKYKYGHDDSADDVTSIGIGCDLWRSGRYPDSGALSMALCTRVVTEVRAGRLARRSCTRCALKWP